MERSEAAIWKEVDAVKTKGGERRKSCWGMLLPLRTDSASYVWGPQHVGFPSHCDGTQDTEPAQQCHCLAFRTAVCCNQKEKKKNAGGGCSWSQGLEYGNMTGPEAWTLGREQAREQGVPLEPGGLGLRLGLGRPAL